MHSADGHLEGYTVDTIDDLIAFLGFAQMMGWSRLARLHRFEDHNGASAMSLIANELEVCPHPMRTKSGLEKRCT
jgi:hypothetical protein